MAGPRISVLITDLDNTLYDWVGIWYASFNAMLEALLVKSGVQRAQLIAEIKAVHQKHKTSEYAFLIEELPSLLAKHPGQQLTDVYADAIDQYRDARRRTLRCYDGVVTTLKTMREVG